MVSLNPPTKSNICVACRIKLRETLNPFGYCYSCDNHFGTAIVKEVKCCFCGGMYLLKSEGTATYSCKPCTITIEQNKKRTIEINKKDYVQEVKNEFLNLKQEIEVDKDILSPAEMKLYSDTKQVWWIRVIKWVLKFL